MQALPFQKIREIERMLDHVTLEDLVLVFSQSQGDQYLLVYNTEKLSKSNQEKWQIRRLRNLKPSDYDGFDGPVVGFSAIDVILPEVPTHGINFYSITHILQRRRMDVALQQTSYRLAQTLFEKLRLLTEGERKKLGNQGHAEVIQLCLPTFLKERRLDNLVAVLLPVVKSNEKFEAWLRGLQLIYNDVAQPNDLNWLRRHKNEVGSHWLIAFEEARLWQQPAERFIDLRSILRQMRQEKILQRTGQELARRCWLEAQSSTDKSVAPGFLAAAYSLAAEVWLTDEDVEDLVALFPHRNFERFVAVGDALRVYRVPRPISPRSSSSDKPRYAIEELLTGNLTNADYATTPLSFAALAPTWKRISAREILDLGPILWKANHGATLANTFWLLSRDLLECPGPEWRQIHAEPALITDLAMRAALLYSLSEPWTWRQGRYEQFLRHCYAHLVTCLLKQEQQMGKAPLAHYFRALREWYGCLTTDDPVRSLSTILQACKAFRENCERRSDLQMELETADRLADVCESLVFFEHETEISHQEEQVLHPFEVTNYLREVVDSRIPILAPSKPFKPRLRDYCVAHAEWRKMYETISVSRPSLEKFNRLLATYKSQERVAYAAAHELAVLQNAHHRDVERINRFTHAVETGPIIKITLRNPWVTLGVREKLALEVENVGGAVANQFKLELNPTKEFELFSGAVSLTLEIFELGKRHRLEYEIRVKETALALNLSYSYRDHRNQQQSHREAIHLEVRQPHATNVKPRGNLYEVGRPVSTSDRFFGRRAELEQVLTRLVGGSTQPILLRGPRRMGKTSLLHQLELVLRDHQELRRLGLSHELETQLSAVHPVFASLQSLSLSMNGSGQNYYVARFLQTIIEDICSVLHIEWSAEQIKKSFDQLSPPRAFIKQINGIFSQRPGKRLLVLIDEWDEIYREEYNELGTNLRYLLQQEQRISWVFSSTWALHKEIGQHGSPFYNQCFTIELKEMDWESAVRLVIELSNEVGVDWHGDAVVALLELTGQRPYLTQLLCSKIMDCLIEKSTNVVDTNLVAFVASQMITQSQATAHYFGSLWNDESVRKGDKNSVRWMGRLILWALEASGSKSLARSEIREEIANEFKQLSLALPNQDFVNQEFDDQMTKLQWIFDAITLEDKRYTFGIPLIQRWLHQVISHEEDFIKQAHAGLMQDALRQ